jgi:hypothetical protein
MNNINNSSVERNKSEKSSQSPALIRVNQTQIENPKALAKTKMPFVDT